MLSKKSQYRLPDQYRVWRGGEVGMWDDHDLLYKTFEKRGRRHYME